MNKYHSPSVSQNWNKKEVWRLMRNLNGEVVPMYEVHVPGATNHEWFNFYLYNTGYGTFWIIAHLPKLHEIGEIVHEMYGIRTIYSEFQNCWPNIVKGLDKRYDFELLREKEQTFCIERFPDYDISDSNEHWKVATICDIGKPLTMDFLENLSLTEKETIKQKAWDLYIHCEFIEEELSKPLSENSKKIIKKEWNKYSSQNRLISRIITAPIRVLIGDIIS